MEDFMKKIFLALIFALLPAVVFAQNSDLKRYFDYSQDFDGYAAAIFIGTVSDSKQDISTAEEAIALFKEKIGTNFSSVAKLTKNNKWLMEKALNEWDYEEGEIYVVVITSSLYADDGIVIFVAIDEKKNFKYCAYQLNVDELDSFGTIFNEEE